MSGLVYLIPVALFLGLLGLGAFLWSLRSGQFDDEDDEPGAPASDEDGRRPGADELQKRLSDSSP